MSILDGRGLNFDRNAAILLESRFFKSNEHENSLLASLGLEIHRSRLLSVAGVAQCGIAHIFTQTVEQTIVSEIVSICTSDFLAFFFFFYYVVCK